MPTLFHSSAFAAVAGLTLLLSGCQSKKTGAASGRTETSFFREVSEAAGLHYVWTIPDKRPLNILQTIGNGCAFLDYDRDGNLDILLVGPKVALYKGDGHGHFTDVSREVGLDKLHGRFLGCAVGDYDNDGYDDIYLTGYRTGVLLHNERGQNRVFRDVTAAAGMQFQLWGTSAAWVETVPGSGRLDLVVANYARFGPEYHVPELCDQKGVNGAQIKTSCGPRQYAPLKAVLFHNLGGGRFAPPTTLSMVSGRGLGVAGCDYDGSGRPGIAFANDETSGDLLQNLGAGNFKNVGAVSGVAYDRDGNVHGGMGIDWGDYDNDGKLDLLVTTFQNEPKSLYHNEGGGVFTDLSYPSGLGTATYPRVAFGCKFLDYDNDGWLDIAIANGHVQDNTAEIDSGTEYRQTFQLFRNRGPGEGGRVTFEEVSRQAGADFGRKIVGRGLAVGDYDNDGGIDLLLVDSEGKPLLLHNEVKKSGHWLGVRLIGDRSNRDGYGALLTLQTGGRRLVRCCHADGSYMSSSDPRVHFGLGAATRVDGLMIRWPSGQVDRLTSLPIDRYITIHEGRGVQ